MKLFDFFQSSYHRIRDWLMGTVSIEVQQPAEVAIPEFVSVKRKNSRRSKEEVESDQIAQVHYYLGDMLDRIDEYFKDMKAMLRADPESYDLFSRIGATVISYDNSLFDTQAKHILSGENAPSMGCVFFGSKKDDENREDATLRFVYFTKIARPINVQFTNDTVYKIGMLYHDMPKYKPVAGIFYVAVSTDNKIRVLKEISPVHQRPGFYRMEWNYPYIIRSSLMEAKKRDPEGWEKRDVHQRAEFMIQLLAQSALSGTEMGMSVRVRNKKGVVASFAINMLRTPYFFSDRELVVNEKGKTRRIIHIVRTHVRKTKNGEVFIRSHFRGLRKFNWNGYAVSVGLGGKHQVMLTDATFAAYPDIEFKDQKFIDSKVLGEKMGTALFDGYEEGIKAFKEWKDEEDEHRAA